MAGQADLGSCMPITTLINSINFADRELEVGIHCPMQVHYYLAPITVAVVGGIQKHNAW